MAPLFPYLRSLMTGAGPTKTVGRPGFAVYGGYVEENEKDKDLRSRDERYRTYSEILANTSIVAAGTRYFLNLVGSSHWRFTPSDADTDGMYAERAEAMMTSDPATPWHRIVRRSAMYRFYGFAIQELTAQRHKDGWYTIGDIEPRAQRTIERWDIDETGGVLGVTQRNPQDSVEIYLPRGKVIYLVDDSLHDSPEGLGLFRHLAKPARRLKRYEQLEGIGFDTDLRGVPVGRAPFTELQKAVDDGRMTEDERATILKPLTVFLQDHIKGVHLGLLLDSMPYESSEDAGSKPAITKQWDAELLQGSSSSFSANAAAIERMNREMARILGVEQMMLGTSTGSYALSQDKTNQFYLIVDGSLREIRECYRKDILERYWRLNGWPMDTIPELSTQSVRFSDVEQIGRVLRDMALAGVMLPPNDPAINDIRDLLNLSQMPENAEMPPSLVPPMPRGNMGEQ